MTDTLLTVEEVADYLRLSPQTVYAYLRTGKMGGHKIGHVWRITRRALQRFVEQSQTEHQQA